MRGTHTPGPYIVHHDENTNRIQIYQDTGYGLGPMLAEITDVCGSFEANARLMAAAPDLLSACEAAEAEMDACGATSTETLERLRAAINAVRGE